MTWMYSYPDFWRQWLKWRLYPGMNLHARQRFNVLPAFFGQAVPGRTLSVLDAGCGNGMLAYKSYLMRKKVTGLTYKEREVEGCRKLFNEFLRIPEEHLYFTSGNLYDMTDYASAGFDEVICSEVLEHLRDDQSVCASFWRVLKPGGLLHICAPNAEHPYNASFPLDREETGGHVRPGYTVETYRKLLEPLGFRIDKTLGLGGPVRQAFNSRIKTVQSRFGPRAGLPLFLLAMVMLPLERARRTLPVPFSIYVLARKPVESA